MIKSFDNYGFSWVVDISLEDEDIAEICSSEGAPILSIFWGFGGMSADIIRLIRLCPNKCQ